MTEEEAVFDPSLKKKKKKKKTPFDLEGAIDAESSNNAGEESTSAAAAPDFTDTPANVVEDVDLDSFGKKKKKKKKVTLDDNEDSGNEADNKDADNEITDDIDLESFGKKKKKKKAKESLNMDDLEDALPDAEDDEEDLDLESFGKKKKKKKRGGVDLTADDDNKENQENVHDERPVDALATESNVEAESPWVDSDRDYSYDELLQRVFDIMKDKNPEVVAGEKKKFVMRPPQVVRVGTKKTAFVNFTEIAKMLHRQPKHLSDFLSAELGTVGAVDGNNQLIMKGRFQQKHIENVLRRYIKEYVTCHTCRSPDTILNKEARLFFLQCMTCHSRCSVQTIKTGFQAVTGKRSAIRAKQ